MIDIIRFKNYRIFRTEQELQLRPITIVFGKNNSGKSAVLKLPILIENILANDSEEVVAESSVDTPTLFTELRDLVYGKATKALEIGVADTKKHQSFDLSFFIDSTMRPNSRIEKISFSDNGESHSLQWDHDNRYHTDGEKQSTNILFNGIIPQSSVLTNFYTTTINKLRYSTDYIGAIRIIPQIDMRLQNPQIKRSGVDGSYSYQMLMADALGDNLFVDKVSKWYESNFAGWCLTIDKSRLPVVHIEMRKNGLHTNIIETGMGIVQSLPIVIRACTPCQSPTLIILEEPETHLHSAAHASLGELVAMSTKDDPNKRYLIETHSKNFILRLRRLIANKQLDINDVALYYVDFDEQNNSSSLREIHINTDGSVDFWPKQMFDESLQETIAIRTIQLKQEDDSRD